MSMKYYTGCTYSPKKIDRGNIVTNETLPPLVKYHRAITSEFMNRKISISQSGYNIYPIHI